MFLITLETSKFKKCAKFFKDSLCMECSFKMEVPHFHIKLFHWKKNSQKSLSL